MRVLVLLRSIAVLLVAGALVLLGRLTLCFSLIFRAIGVYSCRVSVWLCARYGVTE